MKSHLVYYTTLTEQLRLFSPGETFCFPQAGLSHERHMIQWGLEFDWSVLWFDTPGVFETGRTRLSTHESHTHTQTQPCTDLWFTPKSTTHVLCPPGLTHSHMTANTQVCVGVVCSSLCFCECQRWRESATRITKSTSAFQEIQNRFKFLIFILLSASVLRVQIVMLIKSL